MCNRTAEINAFSTCCVRKPHLPYTQQVSIRWCDALWTILCRHFCLVNINTIIHVRPVHSVTLSQVVLDQSIAMLVCFAICLIHVSLNNAFSNIKCFLTAFSSAENSLQWQIFLAPISCLNDTASICLSLCLKAYILALSGFFNASLSKPHIAAIPCYCTHKAA